MDARRRVQGVIDTADHVYHIPSGETWLVAYVDGTALVACGWPESRVALNKCLLTKKATPEEKLDLLQRLVFSSGSRAAHAVRALEQLGLKPCRSPYCECAPRQCTHPGNYDARGTE